METQSKDELIEIKRRRLATMTAEESRKLFLQACERAAKQHNDEFIQQHMERYKQTDHYKERLKRKEAQT